MKTLTIGEQVKRDILKEILDECNILLPEVQEDYGSQTFQKLADLGFNNYEKTEEIRKIFQQKQIRNDLTIIKDYINQLTIKNPNYKIITFSKLMQVLTKYNLYICSVKHYTKEIPHKNAKDIIEYSEILNRRTKSVINDEENHPLSYSFKYSFVASRKPSFFICAPLDDFKKDKSQVVIGREVFYNPKLENKIKFRLPEYNPDPIIIHPIITHNNIIDNYMLLDIVTAWDREALDPEIINEKMN